MNDSRGNECEGKARANHRRGKEGKGEGRRGGKEL